MRALFHSTNLIGDALNISPALQAWYNEHREDWDIDFESMQDQVAELYPRMGVPLQMVKTQPPGDYHALYDFEFTFDVGKAFSLGEEHGCHIAEAYGVMLDVEVQTLKPTYIPWDEDHEKDLILISPFSRSCAVHTTGVPNKTIPDLKLFPVIEYLRTLGKIGVLGGPDDRSPLPISEDEYYTGLPLNKVALMMRDAKLLVTIDNGMAHLGASQEVPEIVLYPACLSQTWIAPVGNPNLRIMQMDPIKVASGLLLRQVKKFAFELMKPQ